jgi:hypothetical protein
MGVLHFRLQEKFLKEVGGGKERKYFNFGENRTAVARSINIFHLMKGQMSLAKKAGFS